MPQARTADFSRCWHCGRSLDPDCGSKGGARPGRYLHFVTRDAWVYICEGCRNRNVAPCAKRTATIARKTPNNSGEIAPVAILSQNGPIFGPESRLRGRNRP